MMGTYKCDKCKSDNIEALQWIHMNTGEPMSDIGEVDEYYCNSCSAQTSVTYHEDTNPFKRQTLDEND